MGVQEFHKFLAIVGDLSLAQLVTLDAAVRSRLPVPVS